MNENAGSNHGAGNGLSSEAHVGTVVDNNDPKHWGRIRIKVSNILDGIQDSHLPWAIVSLAHPGGASAAHGRFEVPEIGAKVLVEFQNGSPLHPVYKGYFIDEQTKLPEAEVNYPRRKVALWPSGSLLIIDEKTNDVFVRNQGDLNFYVTGDMYVAIDGNLTQRVNGDRTTHIKGNDVTVVDGNHAIYSSTMKLKSDGLQALTAGGTQSLHGVTQELTATGNQKLYAGGSSTRDAGGLIHDDSGGGAGSDQAGSKPGDATFPDWPGVRGKKP